MYEDDRARLVFHYQHALGKYFQTDRLFAQDVAYALHRLINDQGTFTEGMTYQLLSDGRLNGADGHPLGKPPVAISDLAHALASRWRVARTVLGSDPNERRKAIAFLIDDSVIHLGSLNRPTVFYELAPVDDQWPADADTVRFCADVLAALACFQAHQEVEDYTPPTFEELGNPSERRRGN